jgi:hypothetical protein
VWKGAHGVSLAITEGLNAESGLVSMGLMAGGWTGTSDRPWFEARALGCAVRREGCPGSGASLAGGLVAWGGASSGEHQQCQNGRQSLVAKT